MESYRRVLTTRKSNTKPRSAFLGHWSISITPGLSLSHSEAAQARLPFGSTSPSELTRCSSLPGEDQMLLKTMRGLVMLFTVFRILHFLF